MKRLECLALLLCACAAVTWASGAPEGIEKGNAAFKEGNYGKAQAYYDEARMSDPESPYIYFDKGVAYYKMEEFDKAIEAYKNAISKTRDTKLEAKANYNLGVLSLKEAGKYTESDLKKSAELYEEAITYFKTSLGLDPGMRDAAKNMEVARVILKDMLDRLKKQEEQNKGKTDQIKDLAEKIAKLIEREQTIVDYTTTISDEAGKKGFTKTLSESMAKLKGEQAKVRIDTTGVMKEAEGLAQGMQAQQQSPLMLAKEHMGNAVRFASVAENQLVARDLAAAIGSEGNTKDELVKALESLSNPQGQNQNKQGQKQDEERQDQKKAQALQAKDILDEEKENQKKRQQAGAGYYAPDKDW